jgi:hypothetical protein
MNRSSLQAHGRGFLDPSRRNTTGLRRAERVYHYTDAGGLLGVVSCKCLWASDVWYLNDAQEALYGPDVIERALDSLTLEPGPKTLMRTTARQVLQGIRSQGTACAPTLPA